MEKFKDWWQTALADSPLQQKSPVCVSTIDEHGYPAGRFVDLKELNDEGFVFCTYLGSGKGKQISKNAKVALTFWWDHVGYQVRVTGLAEEIHQAKARGFWQSRSTSAQLTTIAFDQSAPLESERFLTTRYQAVSAEFDGQTIPMPKNWGGYLVKPNTLEFLTFRDNRLHLRELFESIDERWVKRLLQP